MGGWGGEGGNILMGGRGREGRVRGVPGAPSSNNLRHISTPKASP